MKYRLLFIGLLSVLFVSLAMNAIHSESLKTVQTTIEINDMIQTKAVNGLRDRLIELED